MGLPQRNLLRGFIQQQQTQWRRSLALPQWQQRFRVLQTDSDSQRGPRRQEGQHKAGLPEQCGHLRGSLADQCPLNLLIVFNHHDNLHLSVVLQSKSHPAVLAGDWLSGVLRVQLDVDLGMAWPDFHSSLHHFKTTMHLTTA